MGETMTAMTMKLEDLHLRAEPVVSRPRGTLPDAPMTMQVQSLDPVRVGDVLRGLVGVSGRRASS